MSIADKIVNYNSLFTDGKLTRKVILPIKSALAF